jgi:hypothetical protein
MRWISLQQLQQFYLYGCDIDKREPKLAHLIWYVKRGLKKKMIDDVMFTHYMHRGKLYENPYYEC